MQYKYVLERGGEKIEGTESASSKADLFDKIRQPGDVLISIEETRSGGFSLNMSLDGYLAKFNRVKMQEKILFAKNISAMIDSGLALSRALSVIKRQTKNLKFQEVIDDVEKSIAVGNTFYESLAEHPKVFSPLFVSMVRAGEESGKLTEALDIVGEQMERSHNLQKKIKGAMMYPSIVISAMIIIAILMMIYVVPSLTETFRDLDSELPATTQFIIFVSDSLKNNTLLVFAGLAAVGLGGVFGLRTERGRHAINTVALRLPMISLLVKESNSASTARTLSSLLSSGVEVVSALDITHDVIQNNHYRKVLIEARESIQKGRPLSEVFIAHDNLYPIFFGEMVAVGEETGRLSDMLRNVAKYYEDDVEQKTKDLSTIIEPMLMLVVGVGVGFFAMSMIAPIYSIANEI